MNSRVKTKHCCDAPFKRSTTIEHSFPGSEPNKDQSHLPGLVSKKISEKFIHYFLKSDEANK